MSASIPNQVLVSSLALQEAKDSSAIENIVTAHDNVFKRAAFPDAALGPAAKEVQRYGRARDRRAHGRPRVVRQR